MQTSSRLRGALVGLAAGIAGIATALLLGALLNQRTTIVSAVAEAVRDITPGPLAERLIHLVGSLDKPLLVAGVVLGVAVASAWAGMTERGGWVFAALGIVAAVAAVTRPGAAWTATVPAAAAAVASVLALSALRGAEVAPDPGRRRFVLTLSLVLGASVLTGIGATLLGQARRRVEEARARLGTRATGVVPEGADLDVDGLGPWRVANDAFYRIDTALSVPTITPDEWRLRIHGMVDRELNITYADLVSRERTDAWITLACVSNAVGGDLIGNAYWSGVRIAPLLAELGIDRRADAVLQTSADGWTCGTPLSVLTDGRDSMLAVAMNGEPLPIEHGFPVRTIVPGLYGFVSATKWVTDFEVSRFDRFSAYWTKRGWAEQAPIKTQSRIEVPRGDVEAGRVRVAGTAWAQQRGITRVEVRVDEGEWVECELGRVPSTDTWVQWSGEVECERGTRLITVRATDADGVTQIKRTQGAVPDGATGWHSILVRAT